MSSPASAPSPSPFPLFYTNPVALDKQLHAGMSLNRAISFAFAARVNAVPVTMIELPHVMQFYPIAFSARAPAAPLAILGLRSDENLFVNDKGEWLENTYIPAYIRRYPFIFARNTPQDERLTLCIDDVEGILQKGNDNPLFTESGEMAPATRHALEFCGSYQSAAEQTIAFSEAIEKSGILTDRHAEVRFADNNTITLSGFRQIDEEAYYALPQETVMEWHRQKWTRFIYAHLLSVGNWQNLFSRMEQRIAAENRQEESA